MIWNETKECMSRDEMTALQSARLKKIVDYVYHNVEFYRKKMQKIGLLPSDINGIEDITKLPFTTKDDLRDNYPFGLFAVPMSEIVRIHASSGTTGKATVVGYTRKDLSVWAECVARCLTMANVSKNDIIQIGYGYGLFTGGLGAHDGAQKIGATVVPMSTGNSKKLTTMMQDFGVTAIACTPSYLLHIAELLQAEGIVKDLKLKSAICGAEPWTDEMRMEIEKRLNINAFDIYGLSEIMGPGVACDCIHHNGLHVCEDHFYPEILDSKTLTPQKEGELGELVFTTLTKEGLPLIRYRTKDITSIDYSTCECGRTSCRISKFKGRVDDMLIIRGVNVFPSQVEAALCGIEEITPHYMMVVDRINNLDTLEIQVELKEDCLNDEIRGLEALNKKIAHTITQALGLNAKIKIVEPKSLARSEGKAVHVLDKEKTLLIKKGKIMIAKQLSVFIENRQGRLGEVLEDLKKNDINILSLSLADTTEYGLLRLMVSDPIMGKEVLSSAGFSTMLTDILVIKIDHKAGSLQTLLEILASNDVNIEYMYGLSVEKEKAYVVLKASNIETASKLLLEKGAKLLSTEEVANI